MKKTNQTSIFSPMEAMGIRQDVATFWREALELAKSQLAVIREEAKGSMNTADDAESSERFESLVKSAKLISDQIRRDNQTEHFVEKTTDRNIREPEKKQPLRSLKLRAIG